MGPLSIDSCLRRPCLQACLQGRVSAGTCLSPLVDAAFALRICSTKENRYYLMESNPRSPCPPCKVCLLDHHESFVIVRDSTHLISTSAKNPHILAHMGMVWKMHTAFLLEVLPTDSCSQFRFCYCSPKGLGRETPIETCRLFTEALRIARTSE